MECSISPQEKDSKADETDEGKSADDAANDCAGIVD